MIAMHQSAQHAFRDAALRRLRVALQHLLRVLNWPLRKLDEACDLCDRR